MSWQEDVRVEARRRGLTISSGYRSTEHNREIGGAVGSYHTKGNVKLPGAFDVIGVAGTLREFFNYIKDAFKNRINELYLNIPGGTSEAIKRNKPLSGNPEVGRPQ